MNKHKVVSIQILRALACLIVLQLHLFGKLFYLNGSLGVDLFFVISGYIIASSISRLPVDKTAVIFFINRFSRVVPYYHLLTVLYYLAIIAFSVDSFNIKKVIGSFLFIPHKGDPILSIGWSLLHEVFFYTFIALCLSFTRNINKLALAYLIFLSLVHVIPEFAYTVTFLKATINYNFSYGMLIFIFREKITAVFKKPIPLLISLAAFVLVYVFTNERPWNQSQEIFIPATGYYYRDINFIKNVNFPFYRAFLFGIPAAMLFASALSIENMLDKFANSFFVKLGDASYSVYLIQIFPFFLVKFYNISNVYILLSLFIITIVISFYSVKVERVLERTTKRLLLKAVK